MKHRPFIGVRVEDVVVKRANQWLRRSGWREQIIPFTGYGTSDRIRVLGRLVLSPSNPKTVLGSYAKNVLNQRGWRNFVTWPVPHGTVRVFLGDDEVELRTDRTGYLDFQVKNHGLTPGWHRVRLCTAAGEEFFAPVQVIADDQEFGIISDIDDTIISTSLPRLFIAAWNSLVMTEGQRQAVPGMARLYQQLLADHSGAPIIYVSTGAWNTLPFLNRFMVRHGFPRGPLLLTDFGPTDTGFMRSGPDHKRYSMRKLSRDLPHIKWVLVGDDGQRDPALYREFAESEPDHVRAIAIRELTTSEQVLAHGTGTTLYDPAERGRAPVETPVVRGPDGDTLGAGLAKVLSRAGTPPMNATPASCAKHAQR